MTIEVDLTAGTVRGSVDDGVARFLGVPYAQPPVGDLRLRPAEPVAPWTGVRDARSYGPTAPKGDYPGPVQPILPEVTIAGDGWLNLNVWTPQQAVGHPDSGLPVFVWIHGGSFLNGSGSLPEYDGSAFARDGVVCVTLNYRLGAEGSLVTADGSVPESLGIRDQLAALRWVRDTIARFGGDPARVTVAGESAGGMSVQALLATPSAGGLFRAAIIQSAAAAPVAASDEGAALTVALAAELDVEPTRDGFTRVDPAVLAKAATAIAGRRRPRDGALRSIPFSPTLGETIPETPLEAARAGRIEVPVLIGTTRDEAELFLRPMGIGDQARSTALTENRFRGPAIEFAEALSARGGAVWVFRFDGVDPRDNGGLGSCHASDVPFVFDTITQRALAPRLGANPDPAVAATVHGAWVDFVRTGNAPWPAYGSDRTVGLLSSRIG